MRQEAIEREVEGHAFARQWQTFYNAQHMNRKQQGRALLAKKPTGTKQRGSGRVTLK